MRIYCKTCKVKLTTDNASKGYKSLCKPCFSSYMKDYYKNNPKKYEKHKKEYVANNDELYQLKTRSLIATKIKNGCVDCGELNPIVLELDHRDPKQKKYSINQIMRVKISIEEFVIEIDKCDTVCANCHRKRTAKQFGSWREDLN